MLQQLQLQQLATSVDLYELGAGLALDVTAPIILAFTSVVYVDLTCCVSATTAHWPTAVRPRVIVCLTFPAHASRHHHHHHRMMQIDTSRDWLQSQLVYTKPALLVHHPVSCCIEIVVRKLLFQPRDETRRLNINCVENSEIFCESRRHIVIPTVSRYALWIRIDHIILRAGQQHVRTMNRNELSVPVLGTNRAKRRVWEAVVRWHGVVDDISVVDRPSST